MCKQFAVAQNNCVKNHYKAIAKFIGGTCKTEDNPEDREDCREDAKYLRTVGPAFAREDTVVAKAMCEDMLGDCVETCAGL
jgi:hypothetical protein